jgi:mono/diheme cytochrome c family protein
MHKATVPSATVMALVLLGGVWSAAAQKHGKVIKDDPNLPTKADSGVEIYEGRCAVCHGVDGKGHGPAAEALKTPPTDLTLLRRKNGGEFPTPRVELVINGATPITAHGNHDVPIWGKIFQPTQHGSEPLAAFRVANVIKFLESMQQ